ncbi:pimeloyl-ACP methyl ester carboxylesterase [Herbihabitans rhizosphaerae]|uniref:Pimeloyl-ACP methyl ester carboxylesterase n=1 Tax=Herbihabitans rhizosphaerae TaxID=1872711 RepID=A0A4Q7KQE2_9PSEU|nr:alpha/beta hydrolase [Herbihabitans rhizosphaerae]RZS39029.1 pimeloyl-ACP methyl ester carboxylesterase [Herbihabitans rhizosphaerae]
MHGIGAFKSPEAAERYFAAYREAMALAPPPDKEIDVDTAFGTTRVYRFGDDGPPIVLLPGMAATSAAWAPFLPALAERHQVYTVDTIGEPGRSVQTAPLTGPADRARWLDEVLGELEPRPVHLFGGSTGGYYAICQAIHLPDRVASVSLLDPTTVTAPFRSSVLWWAALAMIVNRDRMWRRVLRALTGTDALDGPDVRLVLAGIREFRARIPPQRRPTEDELRSVRLPVLAVFAGRGTVHDATVATERARRLLPHAEVELWPDTGHHLVPADRERIIARVLDFVRRTENAPA